MEYKRQHLNLLHIPMLCCYETRTIAAYCASSRRESSTGYLAKILSLRSTKRLTINDPLAGDS